MEDDATIYLTEAPSSITSYGRIETFEIHIHMSASNVSWTFATGVEQLWADDDNLFNNTNTPPEMATAGITYVITVRYVSSLAGTGGYLFNLAYSMADV